MKASAEIRGNGPNSNIHDLEKILQTQISTQIEVEKAKHEAGTYCCLLPGKQLKQVLEICSQKVVETVAKQGQKFCKSRHLLSLDVPEMMASVIGERGQIGQPACQSTSKWPGSWLVGLVGILVGWLAGQLHPAQGCLYNIGCHVLPRPAILWARPGQPLRGWSSLIQNNKGKE